MEQLRLLKDRTGLSLVALGQRTAYSKSSWQRYLNAQQPPPRQAVAALCRVAGVDAERFGARWELAVRAWPRGGGGDTGAAEAGPVQSVVAQGGVAPGAVVADRVVADGDWVRGEEPTVPWWEAVGSSAVPRGVRSLRWRAPSWRGVACAALAVVALLLVGLLWVLARGVGGL